MQGRHLDWGTLIYNYGRVEVSNFLIANALFWLERYGIDGLRVDAVASMLYLDYSRPAGGWIPNRYGGRENIDAIEFLRRTNTEVFARHPRGHHGRRGIHRLADGVAAGRLGRPGLRLQVEHGVDARHPRLHLEGADPPPHHHGNILFGLHYAFSENFILPLSHDEVVHGKRSILGRMPGDEWQRFANLRAYYGFMFGHPGKKLMFMGCEFGQDSEWNHDHSLPWHLLDQPNAPRRAAPGPRSQPLYRSTPALHQLDCDAAGLRMAGHRRRQPQRVRVAAQGQRSEGALRRGRQFHAGGAARLSRPRAVRRPLARSAQHRRRPLRRQQRGERRRCVRCCDTRKPGACTLSFHRLLPSISFLKSDRRIAAGSPHPLGATWDGRGTNFALFSQHRREGRALPVRQERAATRSIASRCRSAPRTSGTAICPTRSRASFTAIASTAPTIPRPGTASITTSC